jgi:thiamine-monophosphate kinase
MGGEPVACFLSLGVPSRLPQRWVDDFINGLLTLARIFQVTLAGGDISSSEKVVADIVVAGQTPSGKAVLRSGARAGDRIYVTGELGGSAVQLQRLLAGEKITPRASDRHFYPQPRLKVGQWLRQHGATAMIDLSDGLSTDLDHICAESRVSAVLDAAKLPIAGNSDLALALHGGEDYELLLTVPKRAKLPQKIAGVRVTEIGEVQKRSRSGASIQFRDQHGRLRPLKPQGWQHFRKSLLTPD